MLPFFNREELNMKELLRLIRQKLEQGQDAVVCTVLSATGSTPRGAGARLAVFTDGTAAGTIGGGAVEARAQEQARRILAGGQAETDSYYLRPNEKADIGMICGGEVRVAFWHLLAAAAQDRAVLTGMLERQDTDLWLVQEVRGAEVTATALWDGALHFGDFLSPVALKPLLQNHPMLTGGATVYYTEPLFRRSIVYVFGCGHVSQALVPVLHGVDFQVAVYDHRPELASPEKFPLADQIIQGDFAAVGEKIQLTAADYAVIMTPGHEADREVLAQVLRTDATYIGCIGSRKKIAVTNDYLRDQGFSEHDIARVHAPIGLPILAQTPAEIAISVAAELIEHRARLSGFCK
jgi:xanthine dehydrogenase accessory factor